MKLFYLLLFVLITFFSKAQSSYQFGLLPSINLNKKLPQDFQLNFKLESRQLLKEGFFERTNDFNYDYVLTDFSLLAAKKIDIDKSVVIGYSIRAREGSIINRSIQQFIITNSYSGFKLSHRISTDQTFEEAEKMEFRLRYRLSSAIALNGQDVDNQEFYLKLNNEYVNSFQDAKYDLEIRILSFVGYKFTDKQKLELGLDYRINSFLKSTAKNRLWISMNWYQVL